MIALIENHSVIMHWVNNFWTMPLKLCHIDKLIRKQMKFTEYLYHKNNGDKCGFLQLVALFWSIIIDNCSSIKAISYIHKYYRRIVAYNISSLVVLFINCPLKGNGPYSEILQYWGNPREHEASFKHPPLSTNFNNILRLSKPCVRY